MKVLLIANYERDAGGISGVVYNTYIKIKGEGENAEIFSTKQNLLIRLFIIFPLIFEIRKWDIIHIHGCSNLGFFPIFLGVFVSKFIFKKKTIVTYHGGGAEAFLKRHYKIVKRILNKVDHITVMSGFLKDVFNQYNIKTLILPNIINIEPIARSTIDLKTPRLVSIRSLNKEYNIIDIIHAFEQIQNIYKRTELKIIGTGSEAKKLRNYCKTKNISDVEFIGRVPNHQIANLLVRSNILISVPSIDNQPMSLLEGFAAGIPIISTKVGGVPYMIEDGMNGFLVEANHPEQIVDKIKWIIGNPDKTTEIIANAQKELNRYKWESVKHQLFALYEN